MLNKITKKTWGCSGLPQKVLAEIRCDCCGYEVVDGEKVYYDDGVVLHFRPECLSGYYNQPLLVPGKNWIRRGRGRPMRRRKKSMRMLIR